MIKQTNLSAKYSLLSLPKPSLGLNSAAKLATAEDTDYNKGGILGGVKFVAGQAGAGALGVLEGIYDYAAGGLSKLAGNDQYARQLMDNDISGGISQRLYQEYNPDKSMQFVGNVASGVGQSLVGMTVAAGAAAISGGTLAPVAISLISGATIGLGAAGKSTAEAYKKTGELGGREFLYGGLSGLLEGGLEAATGAAGKVAGRIASPFAKATAKTAVRQGILKTMIKDGAGEFIEESVSTIIDPYLQRGLKIDENAENATMQEILYSGMVGFTSGAILGGGSTAITNTQKTLIGDKVIKNGNAQKLVENARQTVATATENKKIQEQIKSLQATLNSYDALADKSGAKGKLLIGELSQGLAVTDVSIAVEEIKQTIIANAEQYAAIAQSAGNNITAEALRTDKKDIATKLAIAEYAGKLTLSDADYTSLISQGNMAISKTNFTKWQNNLDDVTAKDLTAQLGVDVKTADYNTVKVALNTYKQAQAQPVTQPQTNNVAMPQTNTLAQANTPIMANTQATAQQMQNPVAQAIRDKVITEKEVNNINTFIKGKNVGINYFYDKSETAVNGYYKNGVISVNLASKEGAYETAVHEYAHYIEETAPNLLNDYLKQVDTLIKTSDKYKAIADKWRNIYTTNENTKGMSEKELRVEIALKISKELIDNPTQFNDIVTNNLTVGQRLLLWFKNMSNRFRKSSFTAEQKAVQNAVKALQEAIKAKTQQKAEVKTGTRADNKYSLPDTDSQGRKLTEEQSENPYTITNIKSNVGTNLSVGQVMHHKDSQARDEQGRLLEVYHGTKADTEFTKFEYNKNKQTGTDYGEAYYFTSDKAKAFGYTYDIDKDERVKRYKEKRKQLLNKFLQTKDKKDKDAFIEAGKELKVILSDESYKTGGRVIPTFLNIKNPLVYNAKGEYYYKVYDKLFATAKEKGNDGIIVYDVIDNPKGEHRPIDVYITFSPSQIKLTTNLNPTANEDIRYSLPSTEFNMSKGELKKYIANNTQLRVFSKGDAEAIVSEILNNYITKEKTLKRSELNNLIDKMWITLNETTKINMPYAATDLANLIINSTAYVKVMTQDERLRLETDIATAIMDSQATKGTKSRYAKLVERLTSKIDALNNKIVELQEKNEVANKIIDNARTLDKYKKGKYSASFLADPRMEAYAKELSKLSFRGNIKKNPQAVRRVISHLSPFYKKDILDADGASYYAETIEADINTITEKYNSIQRGEPNDKPLSLQELQAIQRITDHIKHLFTTYNTAFWGKKTIDAKNYVVEKIVTPIKAEPLPNINLHARMLLNPADVFAMTDRYAENGFLADTYKELQWANEERLKYKREATAKFKEFMKANPKYEDSLRQPLENGLTKGQVISLYLTYERKQGKNYLDFSDARIKVADDTQAQKGKYKEAELRAKVVNFKLSMLDGLTDTDKAFIKIINDYFKWSGEKISEVEQDKWGFANPKEDNYFPISISGDDIYSILGESRKDGFALSRPSFTYKLQKPTPGKTLFIGNVLDVVYSHINKASAFVGFAVPVGEISKLYNTKVEFANAKKIPATNFKQQYTRINRYFGEYLNRYLQDIQGITQSMESVDRALGKVRSWMARGALGLNPKVWFNQLTSIPTAKSVGLSYKYQATGFAEATKLLANKEEFAKQYNEMIDLMPEIWQRYEGSVAIKDALGLQAQSKFDKIMDYTTAPIQMVDKFAIFSLWQGCKQQANGDTTKAVEMMKDIVRKTQPNYEAINRSEIMRSRSQFVKMGTMFMTQPLQNLSRMYTAIDKYKVAKKTNNTELLATAKKELLATTSAFTTQTIAFVMVAQLFKLLLRTPRRDKDYNEIPISVDILRDFGGALSGMFPLARDVYSFLTSGYEPTNAAYSGLSNMLNSTMDLINGFTMLVDGKADDDTKVNGAFRRVILGVTQTFGVPVRNLERYAVGLVGLFDPNFALEYNSLFYTQQYSKLLKDTVEKGNNKKALRIVDSILKDKGVKTNDKINAELLRLYKDGYSVFPVKLGNTITNNGVKYTLTQAQKNKFTGYYTQSFNAVNGLLSSSEYNAFDDAAKAKAIKYVYDGYYNKGLKNTLDISNKSTAVYQIFDIMQYALYKAYSTTTEADKDKQGNTINGSKKKKVVAYVQRLNIPNAQKALLIFLDGYSVADGELRGFTAKSARIAAVNYINSSSITTEEKQELAKTCGFRFVNSRAIA